MMKHNDKLEPTEAPSAAKSVMASFMTDLANNHASSTQDKSLELSSSPDDSVKVPKAVDDSSDFLTSVLSDQPNPPSEQPAVVKENASSEQQTVNKEQPSDSPRRDTPTQEFAKATLFSTSKVPLIVYGCVAFVLFICGQFPTFFASALFSPEELQELPAFILDNLPTVFGAFFYLLALGAIYLGIKESFTGKLNVYEDYLAFKKGLIKTDKMHYADLRSIVIHRSPYSAFGDIGHLEVMGRTKEFMFKNVSKPFQLKEILLERKNIFLNSH